MSEFTFDENQSPQENIELFYEHLRSVEGELTAILQTAMAEILSLPEAGPDRNLRRSRANDLIQRELDSLH